MKSAARARTPARVARYCTPELTWRIEHRILDGASLSSLSKEPDMPSAVTLYKWVRTRPAFAAAITKRLGQLNPYPGERRER